jgi:hypothetical protein
VGLVGKMVTLLFHEQDPTRIEVILEETSHGFLVPLNTAVNSRIRRAGRQQTELLPAAPSAEKPTYRGGSLFEPGDRS